MPDFTANRRRMVDNQIRTSDVTNRPLLAVFEDLPREAFLPEAAKPFAYTDQHLELGQVGTFGERRFALAPALLARMIQAVEPVHDCRVLDVGCGTGYASAIFAKLGARVTALDEDEAMISSANAVLASVGVSGVSTVSGNLAEGAQGAGPFDVIFIEGVYEQLPEKLLQQLAENGRLIGVHGKGRAGEVMLFVKSGGAVTGRAIFDASVPPLAAFSKALIFAF